VFEVDPLRCSCGGELEIVEFYTDGHECADYLERCGLPVQTADPKPARSPPGFEEFAEPAFEDYVEPEPPDEWYGIFSPLLRGLKQSLYAPLHTRAHLAEIQAPDFRSGRYAAAPRRAASLRSPCNRASGNACAAR